MLEHKSKKFLDLAGEDNDGDTCGEPDGHLIRNELDESAEAKKTNSREHDTGQESCKDKPFHAVLSNRGGNEYDESSGWSANLEP